MRGKYSSRLGAISQSAKASTIGQASSTPVKHICVNLPSGIFELPHTTFERCRTLWHDFMPQAPPQINHLLRLVQNNPGVEISVVKSREMEDQRQRVSRGLEVVQGDMIQNGSEQLRRESGDHRGRCHLQWFLRLSGFVAVSGEYRSLHKPGGGRQAIGSAARASPVRCYMIGRYLSPSDLPMTQPLLFSTFDVTRQVFFRSRLSFGLVNLKPILPGRE